MPIERCVENAGSGHARFNHIEASRGMKRCRAESAFSQQAVILLLGTFSTAGAPKHIQVAHDMRPVLIADARRFRHQSFHQQKFPILWQGLVAIPQNDAAALVIPIVNHTFQDDGVRPGRNRLKEIAGEESSTVGDCQSIKMPIGSLGASGKIENGPRIFGYFFATAPMSSPEPPPTSIKCEMAPKS